ncbi:hypothetical protein PPL_06171 [Heterostelium album PN500]|uniref:NADH-ubiquinone oxidoreductase subunit B14.7 n=1 Tax=Heterostelium pallidum (strain ATCC 26659 / Pp 5 / PN500) TaxID=670386 RepID=D3BCE6_HETP5|nr:hypothetical protein PPL_06171 [Heterostelium album PN500]EFA80936.1 hypothetical protein PPL_06171 [Heterostelium album PN500]|eukprot:XP_020433054.1 hypothetical protein PPL_06171 [Heterostelium album PN500]
MTAEESPMSKVVQTGIVGGAFGALAATNITYPKTPFVTQTTLPEFFRSTNSVFAKSITAGALLGLSYSAGKHFTKSIRQQDDMWNDVVGSLAAALTVGIYKSNIRITVGAALLFAPAIYAMKRVNFEIDDTASRNAVRINKEARTDLFLQTKLKELNSQDEALDTAL